MMGALLGALAVMVGCSAAPEDDASSSDQAQTARPTEQEADFVVLDRMGRPEMSNVTIGMGMWETDASTVRPESAALAAELAAGTVVVGPHVRAYNRQNVFHPKTGEREHARRILGAGIRALDTVGLPLLRDPKDWQESEIDIVTDILSEDALVVDIAKPCTLDSASFFDLEREEYLRRGGKSTDPAGPIEHKTCGGRVPNDDIIDDVLTMFVSKSFDFANRSSERRVTDLLDRPTLVDGNPTTSFPYLGEPHADFAR
jgi:hypothetical protein